MGRKKAEDFPVEVILGARVNLNDDGSPDWEYLVRWAGYDEENWEPEKHLIDCGRLLTSFWNNIGFDNKDYHVGDEVIPTDEWIGTSFFYDSLTPILLTTFLKIEQESKRYAADKIANEKRRKNRNRSRSTNSPHEDANRNSEETQRLDDWKDAQQVADELFGDFEPEVNEISQPPPPEDKTMSTRISKKRKIQAESSSDDEPLANSVPPKKVQKKARAQIISTQSTAKAERQPLNPQAKIGRLAPSEIPVQSVGISTKQRIGQGALAPTKPKELLANVKIPGRKESVVSKLNFTKKPSQHLFDATSGPSTSHPNQEAQKASAKPPVTIQRPTYNSPSLPQRNPVRPPLLNATVTNPVVDSLVIPEPRSPSVSHADMFLQSIMPHSLAAPMPEPHEEDTVQAVEPMPPKPLTRPALPTRMQKSFKWYGELRLRSGSQTETCKIQIDNVSLTGGLGFSTVFQGVQAIEILSMYDFADFEESLTSVCQQSTQTAQLSVDGDDDQMPFSVTAAYMEEFQKIALFPIIMDEQLVGQVVFMPQTLYLRSIIANTRAFQSTKVGASLVCAILRYTLSEKDYLQNQPKNKEALVENPPKEDSNLSLDLAEERRTKFSRTTLHRAVRDLRFPTTLFKYLNDGTNRPYTIWTGQPGYSQPRGDVETHHLQTILDAAGIKKTVVNDSRFVFIHVSALDTVHKLAGYSERRGSKLWVYFYTYGTSVKVDPCLWGVHEIWPCGGIVTFTPAAIIRDPIGVRNLIVQISRHPLWACYVLPVVVGAAAADQCGSRDPLDLLSQKEMLVVQVILHAIEEGNIALLEAPPEKWTFENDGRAQWIKNYASLISPTQSEALKRAVTAFVEIQAQVPRLSDVDAHIINQLSRDLSQMERNPAFIRAYRRYVVIQDERDADFKHNDGLEWLTLNKFDFQDEFFPKQDVGLPRGAVEQSA